MGIIMLVINAINHWKIRLWMITIISESSNAEEGAADDFDPKKEHIGPLGLRANQFQMISPLFHLQKQADTQTPYQTSRNTFDVTRTDGTIKV